MDNLSRINTIKRSEVEKTIQIAQMSDVIRRLIIFGSAVTDDCREESDVDICLDVSCSTRDKRLFRPVCDFNKACNYDCDIFFYHKLGNKLKREIDSKGVVVYAAG
ncbi:MAG: nucleotidyltransferase domain-containing protein [Lachnospiraceae bacterium]|nr:nucleotidyltransferase domain-containing protein [Lachnospiraceae bacterium]